MASEQDEDRHGDLAAAIAQLRRDSARLRKQSAVLRATALRLRLRLQAGNHRESGAVQRRAFTARLDSPEESRPGLTPDRAN